MNVTIRINGPWTGNMWEENIIFRVLLLKQFINRSIGLHLDLETEPKPRFWFQVITQDPFSFLLSLILLGGGVKWKREEGGVKWKEMKRGSANEGWRIWRFSIFYQHFARITKKIVACLKLRKHFRWSMWSWKYFSCTKMAIYHSSTENNDSIFFF